MIEKRNFFDFVVVKVIQVLFLSMVLLIAVAVEAQETSITYSAVRIFVENSD